MSSYTRGNSGRYGSFRGREEEDRSLMPRQLMSGRALDYPEDRFQRPRRPMEPYSPANSRREMERSVTVAGQLGHREGRPQMPAIAHVDKSLGSSTRGPDGRLPSPDPEHDAIQHRWLSDVEDSDAANQAAVKAQGMLLQKEAEAAGVTLSYLLMSRLQIKGRCARKTEKEEEENCGEEEVAKVFQKVSYSRLGFTSVNTEHMLAIGNKGLIPKLFQRPAAPALEWPAVDPAKAPTPAEAARKETVKAPMVPSKPACKPPRATVMPTGAFVINHRAKLDARNDEQPKEATKQVVEPKITRLEGGTKKKTFDLGPRDGELDKELTESMWARVRAEVDCDDNLGMFEVKIMEQYAGSCFFGKRHAYFNELKEVVDRAVRFRTRHDGAFFVIGLYVQKHPGNAKRNQLAILAAFRETYISMRDWARDMQENRIKPLSTYIIDARELAFQSRLSEADKAKRQRLQAEKEAAGRALKLDQDAKKNKVVEKDDPHAFSPVNGRKTKEAIKSTIEEKVKELLYVEKIPKLRTTGYENILCGQYCVGDMTAAEMKSYMRECVRKAYPDSSRGLQHFDATMKDFDPANVAFL